MSCAVTVFSYRIAISGGFGNGIANAKPPVLTSVPGVTNKHCRGSFLYRADPRNASFTDNACHKALIRGKQKRKPVCHVERLFGIPFVRKGIDDFLNGAFYFRGILGVFRAAQGTDNGGLQLGARRIEGGHIRARICH